MKEIQKERAILEHFCCMIGNTADVRSFCSSRSDGDMLWVWLSCNPFVLSEHGVKMTAPLEVCTKDKQHAIVHFFGVWRGRDPLTIGCQVWTELSATMKCVQVDQNV
jgi:hypothetical protein